MTKADDVLDTLLRDMDAADPLYRFTSFWRTALDKLVPQLKGDSLSKFRSLPGPLSFIVPTYSFPGYTSAPERFSPLHNALSKLELGDARCATHLDRRLNGEAQAESDYRVLLAAE